MLQTAPDVYDRVNTRLGKLARRADRPLMTPSPSDEDALQLYLEDAIQAIGTETDRMTTSIQIDTVASQGYVQEPPYLDRIDQANVIDASTAYTMTVHAGSEVAQWARDPASATGRPTHIGVFDQRLYLHPIPDAVYTLDLQITYNGVTADASPTGVQDPPTLDTMVGRVPGELAQGLVAYVVGRWLKEIGEVELAAGELETFAVELDVHDEEPAGQKTTTRDYDILGL